jgi:uncharacterized Fe-S center protein
MEKLLFTKTDEAFQNKLGKNLKTMFQPGESIAIKLHMGEKKNKNHLKPEFVRKVVDVLKRIGCKPFLFDSPVMYGGNRGTVEGYKKQNQEIGFTEQVVGCPVIIDNDHVEVKGKHMTYQVCKRLAEADGVLVLTHFKGHTSSGIGGSIKNLGMGALTKASKKATHEGAMPRPELSGKCILCKKCLEVCPQKCITYNETGPVFDYDRCYGGSKCIQNCPQKCLKPKVAEFDILLADGGGAALSKFKKAYFVNVLRGISDACDCHNGPVKVLMSDIGILMGRDIVAIDKASVDMINKKAGKPIFDEIWHKDSEIMIRTAEQLGMGKMDYNILSD